MNRNSFKIMLFGIGIMILGNVFAVSKTISFEIIDIALGVFGFIVLMSGFFSKD